MRLLVGPFGSRKDAEAAKGRLEKAGWTGTLRQVSVASPPAVVPPSPPVVTAAPAAKVAEPPKPTPPATAPPVPTPTPTPAPAPRPAAHATAPAAAAVPVREPVGKRHPSLVDPGKARCAECHAEILKGEVKHPPAEEGCLSCHEFSKKERQTLVALLAEGPALCVTCHGELERAAEGKLARAHAPVSDSCGHCHSPHSSKEAHLLKAPALQLCLSCHDATDLDKAHPLPVSRSSCVSCHGPHGTEQKKMLLGAFEHAPFAEKSCESCHRKGRGTRVRPRVAGAALCYTCHSDLEAAFARGSVHTVVRDGRCTDCHSPHVASAPKLVKTAGNALCFSCHPDVKAKVSGAGAHAPAKDRCTSCHDPHRSDVAAQLKTASPALCLACHPAKNAALAKKHLGADLSKVACTSCHDPHGSAGKHLLAGGSVDAPFADGSCDTCHVGGKASALAENGGKALCTACHADVDEAVKKAKVPHAALEGACTVCHNPHASKQPKLLRASGEALCTSCHEAQARKGKESTHGAITWIGCPSCHMPHGGEEPKLLRLAGNDLCNSCHLAGPVMADSAGRIALPGGFTLSGYRASRFRVIELDKTRKLNHPIAGHPVAGKPTGTTNVTLAKPITEMSCLSCHVPHNGKSPELFAFGAATRFELCASCHPK
jgi:predicted CXXCH cytochrome family protein